MVALDAVGANQMEKTTRENIGKEMAAVLVRRKFSHIKSQLDRYERVISVARIQGVFSKRFMITGLNSMEEAETLASHMRSGQLVAPMRLVEDSSRLPGSSKARESNN
jgi:preprotein translocase subunit SecD